MLCAILIIVTQNFKPTYCSIIIRLGKYFDKTKNHVSIFYTYTLVRHQFIVNYFLMILTDYLSIGRRTNVCYGIIEHVKTY